jgi:hypothetical protein
MQVMSIKEFYVKLKFVKGIRLEYYMKFGGTRTLLTQAEVTIRITLTLTADQQCMQKEVGEDFV